MDGRCRHVPQDAALLRLAAALLIDQNDDWLVTRRYLSEDSMAELLTARASGEEEIEKEPRSRKGAATCVDARADERGPRTPLDATQLTTLTDRGHEGDLRSTRCPHCSGATSWVPVAVSWTSLQFGQPVRAL